MSLRVENITAGYYPGINVIQDVSIKVDEGQLVSIIGPNGAGKSTLLRAIYGLLPPRSGRVIFNGEDITRLTPFQKLAKGIAFIQQERSVFPYLTVREHLELGGWLIRKDRRKLEERIDAVLDRYPLLQEKISEKAINLSGGMQRILELARAHIIDPKVIFFDEPTAGLAPIIAKEIYNEIKKLRGERTIIVVDQNLRAAMDIAEYTYVLELGRIRGQGKKEDAMKILKQIAASWIAIE
jgi:branched-chain amino acid transport system ATP-binding protein